MNRVIQWLIVIVPVICVALIVSTSRAQAQQATAQASTPAKGCNPCIGGPFDNWTAADEQRVVEEGMRECKAHPEQCQPHPIGMRVDPKSYGEYMKARQRQFEKDHPNWHYQPGHDTACFSDADNPSRPVCIPDTWVANGGNPQRGQCYSDPKDPSNRRCVPLVGSD